MGGRFETLGRILTSMLSLMTRLRKAEIHTFVSEERKLYHNDSMSPIPQKLIANYSIRGLAVPRAGDRSLVTDSIHGGSRSHFTYTVAHPGFGNGRNTTGLLKGPKGRHGIMAPLRAPMDINTPSDS